MSESVQATKLQPPRALTEHALGARAGLWVGVAATVGATVAFLLHQLMAWPPHEDETLALFVGRDSLAGVVEHVTRERGGAPLHFVAAWSVAHLGFGLGALRLVSTAFAAASLPLVALLGLRLGGRREALVATALAAASWTVLFHGVYGRMYSLFLFLGLASTLALLRALDRGGRTVWLVWGLAVLLAVAAHPYGALLVAGQAAYVALARRDRLHAAARAFAIVLVAGIPFWLTDLVLAGRFDVGVGGGGEKLGDPWSVARYLWRTAGDFSTGWWPALLAVLALAAVGLATLGPHARLLLLALTGVPTVVFLLARLGGSTSPETRHLIFVFPLFAVTVAAGLVRVARRPAVLGLAVLVLVGLEVSWAWHRTPQLFEWEAAARQAARADAERWLARTSRSDDLLFGYEPLYLGAWERDESFPRTVLPRADATLALRVLNEGSRPLGRGVWVFDASEGNNRVRRLRIAERSPEPASAFEARAFGPFLVVRTRRPTGDPGRYLRRAASVMRLGKDLAIGDAWINAQTVERALRAYGSSVRSRSMSSR